MVEPVQNGLVILQGVAVNCLSCYCKQRLWCEPSIWYDKMEQRTEFRFILRMDSVFHPVQYFAHTVVLYTEIREAITLCWQCDVSFRQSNQVGVKSGGIDSRRILRRISLKEDRQVGQLVVIVDQICQVYMTFSPNVLFPRGVEIDVVITVIVDNMGVTSNPPQRFHMFFITRYHQLDMSIVLFSGADVVGGVLKQFNSQLSRPGASELKRTCCTRYTAQN